MQGGYDARMLTLVLGDRNLSSWSFRVWLALRQLGLPFEEHVDNVIAGLKTVRGDLGL